MLLDINATYDITLKKSTPLHKSYHCLSHSAKCNNTPLILVTFERHGADILYCLPPMKHNPSPLNSFRSHETDSSPMKQSPLPLNTVHFHEPLLFHPRDCIIPVTSFLISEDFFVQGKRVNLILQNSVCLSVCLSGIGSQTMRTTVMKLLQVTQRV